MINQFRTRTTLALLAGLACFGAPVPADDSDIFLVETVEPNVVILLDSSGSMDDDVDGTPKIEIAQDVITNILQNVEGIRFGIFRFNENADGGVIVSQCGEDPNVTVGRVNSIQANGSTPLGRATQTVQDYFMGTYYGATCVGNCEGDDDEWDDDADEDFSVPETYPSPIEYECQKNYAIIVTDGLPNGESSSLVTDVAESLFTTDHSPLAGMQNVIVHTIGFDVPAGTALLTATAAAGGGQFYTASSASDLEQALLDAISQVIDDSFSFAQPLLPAAGVTAGTRAYLTSFEPNLTSPFWPGSLRAYDRESDGSLPVDADGQPLASALAWDAASLLNGVAAGSRTIKTVVGGSLQPFATSNASLTAAMLGITTGTTAAKAARRASLINFVRGVDVYDRDGDGSTTDDREHKLGDIFHSAPVLVFPPPLRATAPDYNAFKLANSARTTILLAGANDGMLHAFRAGDGVELWSFIPPDLLDELVDLTLTAGTHPYYVDGSPIVADVKTSGAWKTIALFGERRGGRYYHALDITDTTNPAYLWSFTSAELGETWSDPAIGKVRMADGTERYAAFIGGGYDTASNNASGRAVFAIDLATGLKLWQYSGGVSADQQYMNFSIPARPAVVDMNADGFLDRLYVGDVGGQLWKFDLSPAATLTSGLVNNWPGKRLFVSLPAAANPPPAGEYHASRAMYGTPALAYDENGTLWVFVGTGDRNNPKDPGTSRFFAIADTTSMANGSALTEAALGNVVSGSATAQGWYYPLPTDEKVLSRADVYGGVVYFTTYEYEVLDPCTAANGVARLYAVTLDEGLPALDWDTGEKLETPNVSDPPSIVVGEGIPSAPEIVVDPTIDTVVIGTTEGAVDDLQMPPAKAKRLRYWRENY